MAFIIRVLGLLLCLLSLVLCEHDVTIDELNLNLVDVLLPCNKLQPLPELFRSTKANDNKPDNKKKKKKKKQKNSQTKQRKEAIPARIADVPKLRTEVNLNELVQHIEKFSSFGEYISHHVNLTVPSPPSPPSPPSFATSPMELWSPSPDRRLPPYTIFDSKSRQTRLTWCAKNKLLSEDRLWNSFRDRRVVFMGDSLTRYQYLDLIYFLTYKQWPTDPAVTNEKLSSSWTDFFTSSLKRYKNMELCECMREVVNEVWKTYENRKFFHPKLNATVWFFEWFGDKSLPHGHFNISQDIQPLSCMPANCNEGGSPHFWRMRSAADFIYEFVVAHKPQLVILNTGIHMPMDGFNALSGREGSLFLRYSKLLRERGISTKLVFKSTTPKFHNPLRDSRINDFGALQLATEGVWEYWDVSRVILELYTVFRKVELPFVYFHEDKQSRGFVWDGLHFTNWVYSELNKWMIIKFVFQL